MSVSVIGLNEARVKLNNLPLLAQDRIMGSVVFRSSKVMEEEQKHILNVKTKPKTRNLYNSISRWRVPIKKSNFVGTVRIGPKVTGGKKGYHGKLIEFGHKKVLWGHRTNERVPAYPFIAPAYDSKIGEVRENMFENLNSVLTRWVKTGKIVAFSEL